MSNRYQRTLSLAGVDASRLDPDELRRLARELLNQKIHGICFSPYVEGQGPGSKIHDAQIRERLAYVQPSVRWIRTFSCTDGQELIPKIAAENGLNTMVGVWLDSDLRRNDREITNAIEIAAAGHAGIIAVGNEVLLRGDLSEEKLTQYIQRVKDAAPTVDVGYVDAYFKFNHHPRTTAVCDVILANCYPFWEACPAETSLLYMKEMYRQVVSAAKGKKVIISETGWPNLGSAQDAAVPSFDNAIKYFINTCQWAEQDGIEFFYFSAFDENWKTADEGDVGAYWGLWDASGRFKYG